MVRIFLISHGTTQTLGFLLGQRPDRTDFHALPAENAFAFMIGQVAAGDDLAFLAAVPLRDRPVDHHLIAGLNAAATEDAAAEIANDQRIPVFLRINIARGFFLKPQIGDFVKIGQILQAAVAVGLADQAVVRAAGKQQFHIKLSGLMDEGGFRENLHARRNRR